MHAVLQLRDSLHLAQSKDLQKQYNEAMGLIKGPEEASSQSEVASQGASAPQGNITFEQERLLARKKELELGKKISDNLNF